MSRLEKIDAVRSHYRSIFDEQKKECSTAWNVMMASASLAKLAGIRADLYGIRAYLTANYSAGKVKKHIKRLRPLIERLNDLDKVELNSKNYVRNILCPAKELITDIVNFKDGSLKNAIPNAVIKDLAVKVEKVKEETKAEIIDASDFTEEEVSKAA